MALQDSQISSFFENQTIFVTGGTGFVGKLLIEKLLRTCWDLKRIYVLMRPKRNKTAEERFEELFKHQCFDKIRDKNLRKKVSLIIGDCKKPLLGLNDSDSETLKRETTCVIHAAVEVKFNLTLKEASYHVRATRDLIELSKQMSNLKVFLYISTAMSNCIYSEIREEFYQPPLKPERLLDLVDSTEDAVLQKMTPALLNHWPNTYTFCKSISEDLFKSANLDVPIAIIRPAIILNTIKEPVEGWIDNFYTLIGVSNAAYFGILRSVHADPEIHHHIIPVDYVCNVILAAAWNIESQKSSTKIYNCCGRPLKNGAATQIMDDFYWKYPSVKYLRYKSFKTRKSKFWHNVTVFWDLILIYMVDLILRCFGKSTGLASKYKQVNTMANLVSYFSRNEWNFVDSNVNDLWNTLNPTDKKLFKFSMEDIDWYEYFRRCILGTRIYLLKEPLEMIPEAQRKLKILCIVHYSLNVLFYIVVIYIVTFLII